MFLKTFFISILFIVIVFGCSESNNELPSKVLLKKEIKKDLNRQVQFVHLFCNERVIIKDQKDSILFDKIVNSPNCNHADSSKNYYYNLPKNINIIKLSLPNHQYTQEIMCEKNKNIILYFHDGDSNEYRKGKDTILVDFLKLDGSESIEW